MMRKAGRGIGGAAAGGNQVPPHVQAAGIEMPVNLAGLTDVEVRTVQEQMDQAITLQAQPMIA